MKTIPNDPSLSGAVVFERGTKLLARLIIKWMARYAKRRGLKPLPFSHMETLVWDDHNKILYTIGARKSGAEITPAELYYGEHDIMILKPKYPLCEVDNGTLWVFFTEIDDTKYQFGKLLDWVFYILYGWKLGKQGARKNVCYELAARFSDVIKLWDESRDKDYATPYDWLENEKYVIHE